MDEASRLIAPVFRLKCDPRGNFSADTLLLPISLFAEASQFRSTCDQSITFTWRVRVLRQTDHHSTFIYEESQLLFVKSHLKGQSDSRNHVCESPRTRASFQNSLNPWRRDYGPGSWKMCVLFLELCILSVAAGFSCFGDTDLIHVKRRAGGLDLALQMNFTFSWPACQLLLIPCIDTTGATGKHNNTDVKF